jgi:hypothetical protein
MQLFLRHSLFVTVTGTRRKVHNEELHNLYSSTDIIRMIKSRRMRWVGHVSCMGEMKTKGLKGRDHSKDLGVDRRID